MVLNMTVKEKIIKYSLMRCKYDRVSESTAKHNYAMTSLIKLLHKIKKENIDTSFYLELLKYEDDRVMITAAGHCLSLGIYIDEAKKTLYNLSKSAETPLLRFSAGSLLEKYEEQGYLNL